MLSYPHVHIVGSAKRYRSRSGVFLFGYRMIVDIINIGFSGESLMMVSGWKRSLTAVCIGCEDRRSEHPCLPVCLLGKLCRSQSPP